MKTKLTIAAILCHLLLGCGDVSGIDNSPLPEDEAVAIQNLLQLEAGQRVADVGAGDGEWTVPLAESVGETGRVWATEVKDHLIEELQDLKAHEGLSQIEVVRGDQENLGLPENCCDAVLLRLVYHHFQDPEPMRQGLLAALRPGGRLLVIDIEPQTHWSELEGVPDRGGHGIPIEDLVAELTADGFREVERRAPWDGDEERFAVLFAPP